MDETTVTLTFARGDASADELQGVLDDELPDIELAALGSNGDRSARPDIRFAVEESGQGMDPISTAIIIGITTKLSADAVEALWKAKIWPAIVRKLGRNALGQQGRNSATDD